MKKVEIYTVSYCPYCKKAVDFLMENNIEFERHDITENEDEMRPKLGKKYGITGRVTVPQIIINGKHIGGCDNLMALHASGELKKLLN